MWRSLFRRLLGVFGRRRTRERPLEEADAYARLHGGRTGEVTVVRVVQPEPPRERLLPRLTGEHLRRCFEQRLEGRKAAGGRNGRAEPSLPEEPREPAVL